MKLITIDDRGAFYQELSRCFLYRKRIVELVFDHGRIGVPWPVEIGNSTGFPRNQEAFVVGSKRALYHSLPQESLKT
jgi:hypothetical protein